MFINFIANMGHNQRHIISYAPILFIVIASGIGYVVDERKAASAFGCKVSLYCLFCYGCHLVYILFLLRISKLSGRLIMNIVRNCLMSLVSQFGISENNIKIKYTGGQIVLLPIPIFIRVLLNRRGVGGLETAKLLGLK